MFYEHQLDPDANHMAAFTAEMEAVKAEVHALTAKFPLY